MLHSLAERCVVGGVPLLDGEQQPNMRVRHGFGRASGTTGEEDGGVAAGVEKFDALSDAGELFLLPWLGDEGQPAGIGIADRLDPDDLCARRGVQRARIVLEG